MTLTLEELRQRRAQEIAKRTPKQRWPKTLTPKNTTLSPDTRFYYGRDWRAFSRATGGTGRDANHFYEFSRYVHGNTPGIERHRDIDGKYNPCDWVSYAEIETYWPIFKRRLDEEQAQKAAEWQRQVEERERRDEAERPEREARKREAAHTAEIAHVAAIAAIASVTQKFGNIEFMEELPEAELRELGLRIDRIQARRRQERHRQEESQWEADQQVKWEPVMTDDAAVDRYLQTNEAREWLKHLPNKPRVTAPWVRRDTYPGREKPPEGWRRDLYRQGRGQFIDHKIALLWSKRVELPKVCEFIPRYDSSVDREHRTAHWVSEDKRRPVFMRSAIHSMISKEDYFTDVIKRYLRLTGYTEINKESHDRVIDTLITRIRERYSTRHGRAVDPEIKGTHVLRHGIYNYGRDKMRWTNGKLAPEPKERSPKSTRPTIVKLTNQQIVQAIHELGLYQKGKVTR